MMAERIKILLVKKNMSSAELAKLLGTSPQNLYAKFKRDNFSEKELIKIAEVLNVSYEANFFLEDGTKI